MTVATALACSDVATRLPAQDLNRARRWYSEKLGLDPVEERPGGLRYQCGAIYFVVFQSTGKASGESTQMAWEVDDIEAVVADFESRVGDFWTGTQFVISTATTSPKVAALKARPDVALSIDGGDTPEQARALSVRGRASVEIVDGLVPEYLAAARKSMGAEAAAEFERNCREMYDQMARIAIVPSWVRFYDFGAGRMPKFLKELAERNRS